MYCRPPGSSVHGIFPQEYCSCQYPFPSQGDLPDPGVKPRSPALQTDSLSSAAAAAAKSLQLCPTLCDPRDSSPPGSPVPGILQARTLDWVAISFSNAWKWKVKVKSLSRVQLLATSWTAAHQAPPSMGFSRQKYCFTIWANRKVLLQRNLTFYGIKRKIIDVILFWLNKYYKIRLQI